MIVRFAPVLASACLLGFTFPARADSASAEALFREGRDLLRAGKVDAACAKLAASQQVEASSGTLINLADCHARQGRTASAWSEFLAAARLARAQGNPARTAEAERRAREMEGRLSYLRVLVDAAVPGLRVERDGQPLEPAELGTRLPVDPGEHELRASAPGHAPWATRVSVGAAGELRELRIPALASEGFAAPRPLPVAVAAVPLRGEGSQVAPPSRLPAYLAGGAGLALVGVGGFFGVRARSSYHSADTECPTHTGCSPHALELRQRAGDQANLANLGIAAGVAAIGAGAVLFLTSRATGETPVALFPAFGPTELGANVAARF
jgi:hypothetical protein